MESKTIWIQLLSRIVVVFKNHVIFNLIWFNLINKYKKINPKTNENSMNTK